MNTNKHRPCRTIVYKYIEAPRPVSTNPITGPTSQSPEDSLAYRAWATCYQRPAVHLNLPCPTTMASTQPTSSTSVSSSSFTSSLLSSPSSISFHGLTTQPSPILGEASLPHKRPPLLISKSPPSVPDARVCSSPAILTKPLNTSTKIPKILNEPKESRTTPSPRPRSFNHPIKTSYTKTTIKTITTKDSTFTKERKVVSSHGFRDKTGAVDWTISRGPSRA